MTQGEAVDNVNWFIELYPTATDAQCITLRAAIEPFEVRPFRAAAQRAATRCKFPGDAIVEIASELEPLRPPSTNPVTQRTDLMRAQWREHAKQVVLEREADDELIRTTPTHVVDQMSAAVLTAVEQTEAGPDLAAFYRRRGLKDRAFLGLVTTAIRAGGVLDGAIK